MRKVILTVILAMLITTGIVWDVEATACRPDGTAWEYMSDVGKFYWISGFLSGIDLVLLNYWDVDISDLDREAKLLKWRQEIDAIERLGLFGIAFEQFKDGIDELYQDYRNRKISMVDAMYIVKMEVGGSKPELIDAQIRYLRMQPTPRKHRATVLMDINWKRSKVAQEEGLRAGWFIDPIKENPTKPEDYTLTRLFRYGDYR